MMRIKKLGYLDNASYEVLIVENHPDEEIALKTKKICQDFKVKFLAAPGYGRPYALNRGVEASKGEYIAFTDDDCIITDALWIEKLIEVFKDKPDVGYVSGQVIAFKTENDYQNIWEKKGGLSKGGKDKYWDASYLNSVKYKFFPWPFHKMCAGANFMMPRDLLLKLDGFDTSLGEQGPVKHGYTLDIGYQVAREGYALYYTTAANLCHFHPTSEKEIKRKLYKYGKGDTAYPMNIFLKYKDFRYLWWSIIGHSSYTVWKMVKSLTGHYPLSLGYLLCGLLGNLIGSYQILFCRLLTKEKKNEAI